MVVGSGFDLTQRASLKVVPLANEFSHSASPVEVRDHGQPLNT